MDNDQDPKLGEIASGPAGSDLIAAEQSAESAEEHPQHDLIFKTVFQHFLGDLIELTRPDFAQRVDLSEIEILDKETFSDFPKGTRRIADLVAKLKSSDGQERLVLVQVETERNFSSEMDERSFYYYLYLRGKYRLPILVIVVFLQGGKKGLSRRKFIDAAEGIEVCRFHYEAFCLGQSRAEEYLEMPQALASGLAALMKSEWEPAEKKLRCMQSIRQAEIGQAQRFLLVQVIEIYIELDEAQAEHYDAAIAEQENKEVREMVFTWEETVAAATAKGEAEGEAKGLLAMRNSVLRVLKRRLESVPAVVRAKLDGVQSLERLEEILDQALMVSSADELVFESESSQTS